MKSNQENKFKKIFTMKRLIILIVLVIVAVAAVVFFRSRRTLASNTMELRTAVARTGEISTTVTGSGPISSSNRTTFTAKSAGTVSAVYFKEGDRVKAGDELVDIDSQDAQNNYDNAESNLEQMQETQNGNMDDLNSLTVTAPFNGQVTNLSADIGDTIGKNAAILTLVDTSKLKLTLSFAASGIKDITVGKDVTVNIQDLMDTIGGKVTYVSSTPYSTSSGGELYSVDIEISNPGSLQEGMKASASVDTPAGTVSSIDSASLQYINKSVLKTAGGTVKEINVRQNQQVSQGDVLIVLENEDLVRTVNDTDLKLKSLQNQLESAQEQLDNCKIVSPIDGVIVNQSINVGDSVKVGDSLTVVSDDKTMEFSIPVDELDIQKLKVGQDASITVDALKETTTKPLTGKVTHIAQEGTSQNGVTTYPVTVSIDPYDGLMGGMNANATIYVTRKDNVVYVPLEAIQQIGGKTYVMVKGNPETIAQMKKDGTYIDLFSGNIRPNGSESNTGNTNGNSSGNSNAGSGANTGRNGNYNRNAGNGSGASGGSGSTNGSTSQNTGSSNSSTESRAINSALSRLKDYYADAIPTPVEVGLNNETNIEIVSGLKAGDVVILPPLATGSSSTGSSQTQGVKMPTGGGMNFLGGGGNTQIRRGN